MHGGEQSSRALLKRFWGLLSLKIPQATRHNQDIAGMHSEVALDLENEQINDLNFKNLF